MAEKIWGVYNTFENLEMLDSLEEFEVWKKIDNLGGIIFWATHDKNKSWAYDIPKEDLLKLQYNLEFLVYYTRKFGVTFDKEPSATEHVERSKSYNAWFKFWHDHFESMTPYIYNKFIEDKLNGKDISKYMPSTSFKDYLEESTLKR